MSDILRQVDDDLRKDKLHNLWNKYGLYAISSLLIILVIIIVYQVKNYTDKINNEKLLEIYINASNEENTFLQISQFEELKNSNNKYLSGMAEFKIANLQIEKGNIQQGLTDLQEIIKNERYDPIINDLATYLLLVKKINDFTEDELMTFIDDDMLKESRFKFLFKELISIKKILHGKNDEGKKGFQELVDNPDTPIEIRIRATKFIEIAN
tara:strand:- start:1076 stop:1708 length:633 start_codon:yes stop_codon:yes gene_type:complete